MEKQEKNKRAYTEQETSTYIGMSRSFLRQARMEGQRKNRTDAPPFIKIGRAVRYLKEDTFCGVHQNIVRIIAKEQQ